MDVRDNARALGLTCRLSSSGTLRPVSSPTIEGSFSIESPRFQAPGIDEAFDGATAAMTGRLDRTSREFTMTGLRITVPGLIDADATGNGSFASGVSAEAEVHARVEKLENLAARLRIKAPRGAPERRSAGPGRAFRQNPFRPFGRSDRTSICPEPCRSKVSRRNSAGFSLRGGAKLTGRYELARSNETPLSRKSPPTPLLKRGVSRRRIHSEGEFGRDPWTYPSISTTAPLGDFFEGTLDLDGVTLEGPSPEPPPSGISGRLKATGASEDPRISADLRANVPKERPGRPRLRRGGDQDRRVVDEEDGRCLPFQRDPYRESTSMRPPAKRMSFDKLGLSGKARLDLARKTADMDGLVSGIAGDRAARPEGADRLGKSSRGRAPSRRSGPRRPGPAGARGAVHAGRLRLLGRRRNGRPLARSSPPRLGPRRLEILGRPCPGSGPVQRSFLHDRRRRTRPGSEVRRIMDGKKRTSRSPEDSTSAPANRCGRPSMSPGASIPSRRRSRAAYDPRSGGVEDLAARFLSPDDRADRCLRLASCGPLPCLRPQDRVAARPRAALFAHGPGRIVAGEPDEPRGDSGSVHLGPEVGRNAFRRGPNDHLRFRRRASRFRDRSRRTDGRHPRSSTRRRSPRRSPREGPLPEEGFIRIAELRNPILTLKPVALSLRVGTNAFAVEPVSFDLFGGRLELGRTEFRLDPRTGALRGAGSLVLRELDISTFPIPPSSS